MKEGKKKKNLWEKLAKRDKDEQMTKGVRTRATTQVINKRVHS
jgi:hypothetical protein